MNKKRSLPNESRKVRKTDIIGIGIVGVLLAILWATCIGYLVRRDFFGYQNYLGQPVGTFLLFVFLIIATAVYVIMTAKTIRKRKVEMTSTPKWMDSPPWKFPWEGD
jgi:L-asparagine transporter-like permease